jgi:hypothetical protein
VVVSLFVVPTATPDVFSLLVVVSSEFEAGAVREPLTVGVVMACGVVLLVGVEDNVGGFTVGGVATGGVEGVAGGVGSLTSVHSIRTGSLYP